MPITVAIVEDNPNLRVGTSYIDDENVFQAICAGACGYIAKPVMPAQLLEAVEQAFGSASPMSPKIARKVLEIF